MRNYKFRLSEIIPNAWFYKLKEMGNKTRSTNHKTTSNKKHLAQTPSSSSYSSSSLSTTSVASRQLATTHSHHRKSYYISRDLNAPPKTRVASPEPPRKSAKKRRSNAKISKASPSPRRVASSVSTVSSLDTSSSSETLSLSPSCNDTILPPQLPPIITKTSPKTEEEQRTRPVRRYSGLKLRTNSPRMGSSKRIQGRKSVSSQSFAVVKTSQDPRRDFRESMVEMIVENNIRASKDLEDLLACYLSLNSDEYHDLIIKVFKQIWFDVIMNVRLK